MSGGRWSASRRRRALLLVVLWVVFAAGVVAVMSAFYMRASTGHRESTLSSLEEIARLKAGEVALWMRERLGDMGVLQGDPGLARDVGRLVADTDVDALCGEAVSFLKNVRQDYGYEAVAVLDPEGEILYSSGGDPFAGRGRVRGELARARRQGTIVFSDLYLAPDGRPSMEWVVPLRTSDERRQFVGAVLVRVDPETSFYRTLAAWPGADRTAETVLVRREGNDVLYLSELRFREDTALRYRLPASSSLPAARVLRGERGSFEGTDYRGKRVLAAYSPVPGTGWGLVVKVDATDVGGSVQEEWWLVVLLTLVLLGAGGLAVALMWRSRELQVARAEATAATERAAVAEHYGYLVKHANDSMFLLDDQFHIIEVNERAVETYGYPREELVGMVISSLRATDAPTDVAETVSALGPHDNAAVFETRHRRRDGSELAVEVAVRVVEVDGRRFYQSTVRDITDRVQAQRALRESEQRYRTLFEESADALVLVSDVIIDCNVAAERLYGCGRSEIVGKRPADLSPPVQPDGRDSLEASTDLLARAVAGGSLAFDWQHRRADGALIDCEVRLTAVDVGGQRVAQGAVRDVTERRRDQARLARLTRLHRMLSAANEVMVRHRDEGELYQALCDVFVTEGDATLAWAGVVTADGRVEPVARAGRDCDLVDGPGVVVSDGPNGRGVTGRSLRTGRVEVCNDVATDPLEAPWREEAAARGLRASCSLPLRRAGRPVAAVSLYWGEPGFLAAEEIALMEQLAANVSFALDAIDDEHRRTAAEADLRRLSATLERRVEERTAELSAANRELEAFSYSVSHDLRAPLRAIDGFSLVLLEDHGEELSPDARGYLARVRSGAQRMAELIDDLLLLSRVTRADMSLADVDLSLLAESAAASVAERYSDATVEFHAESGVHAVADAHLVRIVLENLLENAWKFTAPVAHPLVEFGTVDADGRQACYVRDNGVGFDRAHADRLFAPFQRFHAAHEFEGTGIGLATVQRIVLRHGGELWAESEPGRGATFFFTLTGQVE